MTVKRSEILGKLALVPVRGSSTYPSSSYRGSALFVQEIL